MKLGKSSTVLNLTIATAATLVTATAANADTKSIFVETRAPHPRDVRFEGGDDFGRTGTTFEGPVSIIDGMDVRDIAVEFASLDMPLRVIVNPRRAGTIRFTVQAPTASSCERRTVNAVDNISGSMRERVGRMIQAKRLIKLCENVPVVQPKLALAYFDLSCSLASDERTFFAIHADAWRTLDSIVMQNNRDARRKASLLKNCKGKGVAQEFRFAWTEIQRSNPGEATALIDEVLRIAVDPKFSEGFSVSQIGIENVRRRKVWDLKRQQIDASKSNDLETALQLTDQIEALRRLEGFARPADLEGASIETLQGERAWFNNRLGAEERAQADEALEAAAAEAEAERIEVPAEIEGVAPGALEVMGPEALEAAANGAAGGVDGRGA